MSEDLAWTIESTPRRSSEFHLTIDVPDGTIRLHWCDGRKPVWITLSPNELERLVGSLNDHLRLAEEIRQRDAPKRHWWRP